MCEYIFKTLKSTLKKYKSKKINILVFSSWILDYHVFCDIARLNCPLPRVIMSENLSVEKC